MNLKRVACEMHLLNIMFWRDRKLESRLPISILGEFG